MRRRIAISPRRQGVEAIMASAVLCWALAEPAGAQIESAPLEAPPGVTDARQDPSTSVLPPSRPLPRVRDGSGRLLERGTASEGLLGGGRSNAGLGNAGRSSGGRIGIQAPQPEDDLIVPGVGPVDGRDQAAIETRLPNSAPARAPVVIPEAAPGGEAGGQIGGLTTSTPGDGRRFAVAPFRTETQTYFDSIARAIDLGETQSGSGAEMVVLDMITGEIAKVPIQTGTETRVGRLTLRLLACETPVEESDSVGDVVLLQIWDRRETAAAEADGVEPTPDFSGWMFAESPALSALDHPRYDVWLSTCITAPVS